MGVTASRGMLSIEVAGEVCLPSPLPPSFSEVEAEEDAGCGLDVLKDSLSLTREGL